MERAFTLIELMIVVAIIAVVAAIAIPNLVASKISSNETAAIAACRVYLGAQNQFHRADFYGKGSLVYANPDDGAGFPDLYKPAARDEPLKLIDLTFANAAVNGNNVARTGYVFDDITSDAVDGTYDYSVDCGLCAAPKEFNRSGRNVFVIDVIGTVYQGQGSEGCVPLTEYPDLSSDWIPVGSEG